MREQASKAYLQVKRMCTSLSDRVVDLNSKVIDVHVNHVGELKLKQSYMGMAIVAGMIALMMGKSLDPKACVVGVSDWVMTTING